MAKDRVFGPDEHHSVSVRKIDNGYICCESTTKNGQYSSREYFSKEKPKVELPAQKKPSGTKPKSNSLRTAVRSISRSKK